jgi:hypothetical protein
MARVTGVDEDHPEAALYAATTLVAGVVVRQRAEETPARPVVEAVAMATTQHVAVLGELAEVIRDQLALIGVPQSRPDEPEMVRLRDTAAALHAALSSAQLFSTELVRQLSATSMRNSA